MRKGRTEEAGAIADKIGRLIVKHNSNKLKILERNDSRSLWKEVNALINKKDVNMNDKNYLTANTLNENYARTSTDSNYIAPNRRMISRIQKDVRMEEHRVFRILDNLESTSSGPDGFPAWFLRLAAPFLSGPLMHLYNISISSGVVPVQWKKAIITPVAKVSQAVSASDYRPISVTSILSRKLEHEIVARHIYPCSARAN